ncbi:hypothetical protein BJ742DRAFT_708857 [Cladochytrium replicatum]|nr:hypothetical protein BJ742DRAFT_708857 [Cladochytrium replicatum]
MIECGHCHTWGHMVCFGFLSPDDQKIPTEFLCYECRNKMHLENPAKYPNEYDPQAIRSLAIFRRALSAVWEEGLESVSWLAERLGVDTNEASGLLRKLQEEQFVSTQGQKKRGRKSKGKAANEEEETERHKVIKFKRCQIRLEKIMSESAFAEFLHEGSKTEGTSRGRAMPIVPEESDQLFPSIGSRIKERSIAGDANTNAFQNRVRKEASRAQQLAPDSSQPVDQVYTQSVLMTGGSIEKIEDTFQQSALNESNMDIDPVEPILKRKFLDELGLSCSQATGFDQGPDVKRRKASVVTHPLAVL